MDIRGILDRVVVILKLGELGRDAVLNIRDALIQPGIILAPVCPVRWQGEGNDPLNDSMALDASPGNERVDLLPRAVSAFLISVSSQLPRPVLRLPPPYLLRLSIFQCLVSEIQIEAKLASRAFLPVPVRVPE